MRITVFLADDNLLMREGIRALLDREPDITIVGVASDGNELIEGATDLAPQVVVADIRMPPSYQREGIEAAKQVRRAHPGTGVVILTQYDDPDYIVSLLADGAAGYAYLLKDRIAEGDQLVRAIRTVAAGGTALDPVIVDSLIRPISPELPAHDDDLLRLVADGRSIKSIAAARNLTAEAAADDVERMFMVLAQQASTGGSVALRRLRLLHQAIIDREEQGERLSRLLPGGIAEKLLREGRRIGDTEDVVVTVLMSDIRGYSTIAEVTPASNLAAQLNEHRAAMTRALTGQGGTVMQFVGDAVLAVFGAPVAQPDHADLALAAALAMHEAQAVLNAVWVQRGQPAFGLGIGLSTGEAAAALLGSDERLEYTLVGDTVNLAQRLQQWGAAGETVLSEATWKALSRPIDAVRLPSAQVKGRTAPVTARKIPAAAPPTVDSAL